jgi:hypothetical protein
MYEKDCTVLLKAFCFTSFKRRAKMIGAGKLKSIDKMLIRNEFQISWNDTGFLKKVAKFLYHGSSHGLAQTPREVRKFLNAMRIPYMGP